MKAHLPLPAEIVPAASDEIARWWKENEKRVVPDHAGVFELQP